MVLNRPWTLALLLCAAGGCGDLATWAGVASGQPTADTGAPLDTGACDDARWPDTTNVDGIDPSATASGTLGEAMLGPGDLSGDGEDDLLLGNPSAEDGAGQLVILSGPVSAGASARGDQSVLRITGAPGDGLGASMALGHGIYQEDSTDLVLGLPRADDLLLLWGPLDEATGEPLGSLRVLTDVESFGTSVASGWGIDRGTGAISDVVVGAPEDGDDAGSVWLLEGSHLQASADDGEVALATLQHGSIVGSPGDELGAAVALGDLSEDGYAELIVGAPGARRAWVISGDDLVGGVLNDLDEVAVADIAIGALVSDTESSDCDMPLGSVIALSPEDGLIALGAPCLSSLGHTTGGALIYDIAAGVQAETPPTLRVVGAESMRPVGASVALAHLDCDEHVDLALGTADSIEASSETGAWIVPDLGAMLPEGTGTPTSTIVYDLADPGNGLRLDGDADGRWNVAAAGDPDGDGLDDLILARPTRPSSSAVWLLPISTD